MPKECHLFETMIKEVARIRYLKEECKHTITVAYNCIQLYTTVYNCIQLYTTVYNCIQQFLTLMRLVAGKFPATNSGKCMFSKCIQLYIYLYT